VVNLVPEVVWVRDLLQIVVCAFPSPTANSGKGGKLLPPFLFIYPFPIFSPLKIPLVFRVLAASYSISNTRPCLGIPFAITPVAANLPINRHVVTQGVSDIDGRSQKQRS
jgi:hypothetical protein